jgi:hypothetical protein
MARTKASSGHYLQMERLLSFTRFFLTNQLSREKFFHLTFLTRHSLKIALKFFSTFIEIP